MPRGQSGGRSRGRRHYLLLATPTPTMATLTTSFQARHCLLWPLLTTATAYYGWPLLTMATAYYGHYCTTGAFLLQHADETRHLARAGRSGEARVRG